MQRVLVALMCIGCGGRSVAHAGDENEGTGGTTGRGGAATSGGNATNGGSATSGGNATNVGGGCAAAPSSNPFCPGPAPLPELTLTPHCSDFVPNIGTGTLDWVGAEPACGNPQIVEHRFRAPASLANGCGYDLVIGLPGLTFAGSGTYDLNAWWLSLNGSLRPVAAILRREGETLPELAVGLPQAGELVSMLSAPMTIRPLGSRCSPCWNSAPEGLVVPTLALENKPLTCMVETSRTALMRCTEADLNFFAVIYCAPEGSREFPVVFGPVETLTVAP